MDLVGKLVGGIRIVCLLGKGGMGEVYSGIDETLQRQVALKVIRAKSRLDAGARVRFLREARILSQLDHPHICRIFQYIEGEEQDFLVLELIQGTNLGDAIPHGELDEPRKMRIAASAAVLKVAHAEGIIHRDLKPHNVMLTNTGDVKVLDFGLAYSAAQASRRISSNIESGAPASSAAFRNGLTPRIGKVHSLAATVVSPGPESEAQEFGRPMPPGAVPTTSPSSAPTDAAPLGTIQTRAGSIVGTPAYMSPEQATGQPATTASDMYSFGLLLHELFSTKCAYPDRLDYEQLMERVRKAETLPPVGLHRDLASLITRLESLAPAARPTAVEVVERLSWIREKPKRRLRRLLAAAMVVALALFGLKYTRDLQRERGLADQRRAQAEDPISFMLGDLRQKLEPVGRLELLDEVGDKALDYFASLSEKDLTDDELFRRSKALSQIGEVRIAQGNLDAAMRSFEESKILASDLVSRDSANAEWQSGLGTLHFWIGYVCWLRDDLDQSETEFKAYLESSERLVALDPENPDWQMEVAYARSNLGSLLDADGDAAGAFEQFLIFAEVVRALVDSHPSRTEWQGELADGLSWLGRTLQSQGDLAGALAYYQEGQALLERASSADPENTYLKYLLGISHNHIGRLFVFRGEETNARPHAEQSLNIDQSLTSRDPSNTEWQRELAVAHQLIGTVLDGQGDSVGALRQLEKATEILGQLLELDESNIQCRNDLASALIASGQAQATAGSMQAALDSAQAALRILEPLLDEAPENHEARRLLGEGAVLQGAALANIGRSQDARTAWERAADVLRSALDSQDVFLMDPLARALLGLGRFDEALPIVRQLHERGYRRLVLRRVYREEGLTTMD